MENEDYILFPSACKQCNSIVSEDYVYCTNCGYPQNGSVKDLAIFEKRVRVNGDSNKENKRKISNARNALYVMAGISFLFGFISFSGEQGEVLLFVQFIQGIIYLILGSWSTKKPLIALLLGLFLYLTIIIISAVSNPETIMKGIIFKVIIIAYLGNGIYSALSIKKYKQ